MRLDKWTVVLGVLAVAATVVLGALAGAAAGALTALAGAVFAVGWQVAASRQARIQGEHDRLREAETGLALPDGQAVSPAGYLRPEAGVVAFRDRPQMAALRSWLVSPALTGVQLVTGPAGSGKTRLALQLAAEAEEQYGWRCYWVPAAGLAQAADAAGRGSRPVLLIVDYAETRAGLADMLAAVTTRKAGPASRVLLLARSAGEWWSQLIADSGAGTSDMLAAVAPVPLGPLTGPAGQEEVFRHALAGFARTLGVDCPSVPVPVMGADAVVLVVHAAALLAVLDRQIPPDGGAAEPPAGPGDVIARLLGHEARYWARSQARYQLALGPAVRERAVAAATLIGAGDEASALRLLSAIGDLADPAVRGSAARWLHDLYPAGEPGYAPGCEPGHAPGEWIGPLRPDLVAETLIVRVMTGQPDLLDHLVRGLGEQRATRALTILGRAALTSPAAAGLLDRAIRSDPEHLVIPAMTVAVETNRSAGDQIAGLLAAGHGSPDLLARIARELPDTSVSLAGIAALTYQRLADTAPDGEQRASRQVSLSSWLSRMGRREDALAAASEAVTAYRDLAAARPDAFLPGLATSLNNQSGCLSGLGRREEALASASEAVTAYRDLAAARPAVFASRLKSSLSIMADLLESAGQASAAETARSEAERLP